MNVNFKESLVKEEHISKHVLVFIATQQDRKEYVTEHSPSTLQGLPTLHGPPTYPTWPTYLPNMAHLTILHCPSTYSTCPIYLPTWPIIHCPSRPLYNAVFASIVRYGTTVWYGSLTVEDQAPQNSKSTDTCGEKILTASSSLA